MKDGSPEERDVWGASQLEDIITRNTKWMQDFIVSAVKALRKDGRPLFTSKVPKEERLARLLEAGPEFWEALQQSDPEAAAQLAADIIRARASGKLPPTGPRVEEALENQQEEEEVDTGTQPAQPIPTFVNNPQDTLAS